MTIRLSAMFEEHIRSIISDWRSAVKYEEKIRNNQYVSNRRKPLPSQEGVNVGASTSRGFITSLPSSSRGESSRHINKIINAAFETPKSSHSSKVANGTGPKKVIKSERTSVMKASILHRKKHINSSIGSSLTNGVTKKQMIRVSKRKIPEKTSKKRVENVSKREPSNTEGSHSDSNRSNCSVSPESNGDAEWGRKVKRIRKDSKPKFHKKLRPRILTRHNKLSCSSLLPSHRRQRRLRLLSPSSSPDTHVVNHKKSPEKHTLSPLHTRSQRHLRDRAPIIHSLRNTTVKPRRYQSSSESSESDESMAHNRKSARISNSSSSSNTSNKNQKKSSSAKRQESLSNESEASSDREVIKKHRRSTRAIARDKPRATRSALRTAPKRENDTPENDTIQTRNRGQRTVRYGEYTDDDNDSFKYSDSENTEPVLSFSSRGRLRKLTNHARAFVRD